MKRLACAFTLFCLSAGPVSAGAGDFVFVTTTDYTTGSASVIGQDKTATLNVASIHSDATARAFGGYIYVVNRAGQDNIQVLDPLNSFNLVIQFSVRNGANPHDIFVRDATTCYVPRYDTQDVWKMNPTTGVVTDSISFAPFADADGLPEIDQVFGYGDRLFVSVQRLDRNNYYTPVGTSYLCVIDMNTDTFIDTDPIAGGTQHIALPVSNPFSEIQLDPWTGNLYVACVGFFGLKDGGVVTVDPETMQAGGVIFSETAAGGDILDVEIVSPDKGFAIVYSSTTYFTDLIAFNPATGVKTATVYAPGDYVLQDIDRAPSGELYLTDRTILNPGVRCFDVATNAQITTNPISTGLPPADLTFGVPTQTGADAPSSGVSVGPNFPNPFNPSTSIPYTTEHDGPVRLDVFDAAGRRVATLVNRAEAAGAHAARWDGRDHTGVRVASGVYFARLATGADVRVTRMVLLK